MLFLRISLLRNGDGRPMDHHDDSFITVNEDGPEERSSKSRRLAV
jgi:hypothetical protein